MWANEVSQAPNRFRPGSDGLCCRYYRFGYRPRAMGPPSKPLVLSHVTVIDVAAGRVKPGMTVIITGDRIEAVGPSGSARTPGNALVVDATGKFLIPGLWDGTITSTNSGRIGQRRLVCRLLVANGIIGVSRGFRRRRQASFSSPCEFVAAVWPIFREG